MRGNHNARAYLEPPTGNLAQPMTPDPFITWNLSFVKGMLPPATGSKENNEYWWTIDPQSLRLGLALGFRIYSLMTGLMEVMRLRIMGPIGWLKRYAINEGSFSWASDLSNKS